MGSNCSSSWVVRRCGNACFALGFFLTAVLVAVVVGTHAGRALLFTAVPEALVAGRTLDALLGDTVAAASCARRPWAHGRALDDGETRALFLVDAYVVAEAARGPAARRNRNRNRTSDAASAEAPTLVAFLFGSLDRVSAPALERAAFRARFRRAARAEWTCTRSSDGVAHAAAPPVLDRHYHALTVVCALPDMDAVGGVNPGVQNPMAALEAPIGAHRATLSIAARDTEGEVLRYSKVAPCRDGAVGAFFAARDRVVAWPGGGRGGGAAARIPLALCTSVGAEDATPRALLPWVVYHRAVGFDAVVVYVNAPRADELIRAIAWSDEGRALVDDGGLVLVPWDFSRGHRAVPFADRGAQGAFFTSILLCTLTLSLFPLFFCLLILFALRRPRRERRALSRARAHRSPVARLCRRRRVLRRASPCFSFAARFCVRVCVCGCGCGCIYSCSSGTRTVVGGRRRLRWGARPSRAFAALGHLGRAQRRRWRARPGGRRACAVGRVRIQAERVH